MHVAFLQRKLFAPKRLEDLLFRFELPGEPLGPADDCQIHGRQFPAIEYFQQGSFNPQFYSELRIRILVVSKKVKEVYVRQPISCL